MYNFGAMPKYSWGSFFNKKGGLNVIVLFEERNRKGDGL
ncbi:hypothetical protein DJ93_5119 [Bacillus clarus]|uniref:Uncharacterized protein n=1 Tax=Bacillus clarus TaxID=2338372 RepID=A0A090YK65_9BACI|nr:hypothetical protein DJ93_5119 [Bacillus clarus]